MMTGGVVLMLVFASSVQMQHFDTTDACAAAGNKAKAELYLVSEGRPPAMSWWCLKEDFVKPAAPAPVQ